MLVIAAALLGYSPLTAHTFWLCVLKCKDLNLYLSSCRFLFRLKHSPQKRIQMLCLAGMFCFIKGRERMINSECHISEWFV